MNKKVIKEHSAAQAAEIAADAMAKLDGIGLDPAHPARAAAGRAEQAGAEPDDEPGPVYFVECFIRRLDAHECRKHVERMFPRNEHDALLADVPFYFVLWQGREFDNPESITIETCADYGGNVPRWPFFQSVSNLLKLKATGGAEHDRRVAKYLPFQWRQRGY